jgi:Flp pilus assembly protein TadG
LRTSVYKKRGIGRRGAAVLEVAITLNVLLILVAGIFEHGRIIMVRQLMQNAAREGARQAIVNSTTMNTTAIQALVTQKLVNSPLTSPTINGTQTDASGTDIAAPWTSSTFGNGIAVQVSGNYQRLSALSGLILVPSPMPLRARSIAYCETN